MFSFVRVALSVAILLLGAVTLYGQQVTGAILGTVVDSSGAVVPNAQITITNQDTGAVRNVVSGEKGEYNAPQIPAGTYTIGATAPGFSPVQVKGVAVLVASDTRVDLKVQVGSVATTVEVSGESLLVDTTNSSVGGLVDDQRVADLPLNGRNWADLTALQPGVQSSPAVTENINGISTTPGMNGNQYSVNGGTTHSNYVSLDGADMMTLMNVNNASITGTTLGVDGIKEYKVVTNVPSAEYGMLAGSQTTIVSKGGTNQFHGDAFDYLRNSALDARNYFDALDTADANNCGTDKSLPYPCKRIPPLQRNDFGASFGGPIQKDKTFFFGTFEGIKENIGNTIATESLPAACYVNGVVPATIANNGCVAGSAAAPIKVNTYILPLANEFPFPNVVGYPTFNYTFPSVVPENEYYGQMRVDRNFSAADSFFARYTEDSASAVVLAGGYPQYPETALSDSEFATVSETHIFSTSLLNTARLSYSRTFGNDIAQQLASFSNPNYQLVSGALASETGNLNGSVSPGGGVTAIGPQQFFPARLAQHIFTLADDVFWDHGKHTFKFGTLMNYFLDDVNYCQTCNGQASFSSLGNFFIGDYSTLTYNIPNGNNNRHFLFHTYGFYGQDDYRVTSRVTLNLGLRYEFSTVPHDPNPSQAYSLRSPADMTGTPGDMFQNPTLHGISPRFGFAWDVFGHGKTSVKGGAGIYYDVASFGPLLYTNSLSAPPIASPIAYTNSLPTPTVPFTVPLPVETAKLAPRTVQYNLKEPTMYQYNLTIEQQLPWQMALSVGYVGARALHLYQIEEANPMTAVATQNGIPIFGCWNAADTLTAPLTAAGSCPAGFQNAGPRTYPNWLTVSQTQATGDSYFDSLQLQLNKRISKGLDFQFAYTWEKLLSTGTNIAFAESAANQGQLPDGYNESLNRGPIVYEVPQSIHLNLVYNVPTIKSEIAGKFLNGWWFSSIVSAQSGFPFTPTISSDRELQAPMGTTEHPNLDPSYNPSTVIEHSPLQWFNPTMFDLQPAGTLGNAGVGILSGPGLVSVNLSAVKDTKVRFLGESGSVEFRAELFNAMNHPNFALPTATVYSGSGAASAAPAGQIGTTVNGTALTAFATAGHISTTITTSRQIQLALKLIF